MSVLGIWIVSVRAEREITNDFHVISTLKIGLAVESFIVKREVIWEFNIIYSVLTVYIDTPSRNDQWARSYTISLFL